MNLLKKSTRLFLLSCLFIPDFAVAKQRVKVKKIVKKEQMVKVQPKIFMYNPDERSGFRIAGADDKDSFKDLGQLFSSDYSRWGSEKKMYSPCILPLSGGGAVAVFQVNDYSPCFAIAYSADLTTWRPQDYPRITVSGCIAPLIKKESANAYSILFKTKTGLVRKCTTDSLFRKFTSDVSASLDEYNSALPKTDTLQVDGKTRVGFLWNVSADKYIQIKNYFADLNDKNVLYRETLADDHKLLLPALKLATDDEKKALNATLCIDETAEISISNKLIGVFFEDISYAADGGLYAEMLQNRDFEYNSSDRREWSATTAWHSGHDIKIGTELPLSINNAHYVILTSDSLINEGWDGIVLKQHAKYDFSCFARNIDRKHKMFTVLLISNGKVLAQDKFDVKGKEWKKYALTLQSEVDADHGQLVIIPNGKGATAMDMISLFPQETFNKRKNGLRKDLAQAIADLHPKFVRFPGGCMSHGDGLTNIYHWNHTVGELQDRIPDRNIWGYHQTRGLGFYEYFQFCEDIGAEPLPVLAAGVPCQNSGSDSCGYGGQQGGIPMQDMPAYIDELCNMIEWANGDPATNRWAKMRADAGHPQPFNLKYIGIGNEDIISSVFEERYLMICQAIRKRYPTIQICGTVGPFHAPSADYIEGWKFAKEHHDVLDMVDEHYYESVGWFLNNQHYYDNYDRKAPKVYLGEYAAHVGSGSLDCALAEAVHLCNIERNGDVVEMTSYAPLLCKDGHSNWRPDMIYFDNKNLRKAPSYETQRLFGTYCGDRYISSTIQVDSVASKRVVASVVKDSKTGKRYLKVANVLPIEVSLTITGTTLPDQIKYEGFTGNIGANKVSLFKGKVPLQAIVLKPYSFSVFEL